MAEQEWDQDSSITMSVLHEVDSDGLYTMTVMQRDGKLLFSWKVFAVDALRVGEMMVKTIEDWMLERADGRSGDQDQKDSPTPGEVWPDAP